MKLSILGFGNMGEAIARALLACEDAGFQEVTAFDPSPPRREAGADLGRLRWGTSPLQTAHGADIVLLAVKPQSMATLLDEIAPGARAKLIVSIAAGITTRFIEQRLPGARVIRAMPNTPLLAGKGVVALSVGQSAIPSDVAIARVAFRDATVLDVDESLMNAVTAVSGSGPAYFFVFVEALAAAAQVQGFDRQTAYKLAAGTFVGAAALLEQSGASAAALRHRVTSPGGTTEAALNVFAERGLGETVKAAVAAATRRGRELSAEQGR